MASALKTIVSKNKRRHVEGGFNLDLSYINDRIIAMGFPAENVESLYRNSMDEVKRFLEQKHENHYFIYNLCSERYYDPKKFQGRVATYPFDDHHPPDFQSIKPFCQDVNSWLAKDPDNVAVVHCKAGKGRTGTMICCYLLHSRLYKTAEEVLKFYGEQRTVDSKGVTIPSQRRYIRYYADMLRLRLEYRPVKLYLSSIVLAPVPSFNSMMNTDIYLSFEVKQAGRSKHVSPDYIIRRTDHRWVELSVDPPLLLCGDVKIEFSTKLKFDNFGLKSHKLMQSKKEFHFWFNTFFVESAFSSKLCHDVVKQHSEPVSSNGRHRLPERLDENLEVNLAIDSQQESLSNLLKNTSISDDQLLQEKQKRFSTNVLLSNSTNSTNASNFFTHSSFFPDRRTRHSSVPQQQPAQSQLQVQQRISTNNSVGGSNSSSTSVDSTSHASRADIGLTTPVSLCLRKPQIDRVFKDKQCKVYPDNFQINLFLLKPADQSDAGTYASSPACFLPSSLSRGSCSLKKSSPESSSEDEEDEDEEDSGELKASHMLNPVRQISSSCNIITPQTITKQKSAVDVVSAGQEMASEQEQKGKKSKKKEKVLLQSDWIWKQKRRIQRVKSLNSIGAFHNKADVVSLLHYQSIDQPGSCIELEHFKRRAVRRSSAIGTYSCRIAETSGDQLATSWSPQGLMTSFNPTTTSYSHFQDYSTDVETNNEDTSRCSTDV